MKQRTSIGRWAWRRLLPALLCLASAAAIGAADERVALRFVNADIDAVVRAVGHYTGRTFVVDPRVKGTVSLVSEKSMTREQALAALTSALRMQGYAIVEAGGVSRVVPETEAKFQGSTVGNQGVPAGARGDQVLTQVFRLQYESAVNILAAVRPLVPSTNPVTAAPGGNAIVVTDYAENLRRIEKVIAALDIPPASNTEVIVLRNAIATDVAAMVARLTDQGGAAADPSQKIAVLADPATNSIVLLSANPGRTHVVKALVASLDQPSARGTGVHVVPLRNAEAVSLAKTLTGVRITDPLAGGRFGTAGGAALLPGQQTAGTDSQGATTVIADAASNSLVITAADPAYRSLRAVIDKLDVRRAQVFIECLIVEVTSDQAAEFGIQWYGGLNQIGGTNPSVVGGTNFGTTGQNIISGARNLGSLGQGLNIGIVKGQVTIPGLGAITNLAFLARALETNTKANILSTPNILTLDNEEAKIVVGQNVPFITGQFLNQASAGNNVNPFQTIERRDVGLTLKVKPQISEGGTVRLTIYQEVSSIQDTTSAAGIITNKRSLETNVIVDDGNIIVLGGLVRDQLDNTLQKVPGLGNIPWLGQLFRYETRRTQKTNLMLFLRPYVIRDESGSAVLTVDRYDAMRRQQLSTTPLPANVVLPKMEGAVMPEFDLRQKIPAAPVPAPADPSTPAATPK